MSDDNTIVSTKQETSEVILPPGSNSTLPALTSIFDKIESAKSEGKTAQEAIAAEPKEEVKEVAKVETKPEVKEEPSDLSKKLDAAQEKKDDGEASREKLRAAAEEKKEEPKAEVKPEVKPEDEVPAEEMQVLPSDKPKTAKRIQAILRQSAALKDEVGATKAEKEALAKERDELKKQLEGIKTVDPVTQAKIDEELNELKAYRRRYDLEKDPEVKTKYDTRVEAAEKTIVDVLTKREAGDRLLKTIKDEGGWNKFSESGRLVEINDGEGGTKHVTASELADLILKNLPLGERKVIEAAMVEQVQTRRDKERYFKEQQDTAIEYFKKKDEEAQRQAQENQKAIENAAKTLKEFEEKAYAQEWIKDKVADPKATPAEKAAIEEHNRYNAQLRSLYKKALTQNDMNSLLEMVNDSVRYYDEIRTTKNLKSENAKLKAELAEKQAALDRFKGAGRSVPKAGSISTSTTAAETRKEPPSDISSAFDRIEREGRSSVLVNTEE